MHSSKLKNVTSTLRLCSPRKRSFCKNRHRKNSFSSGFYRRKIHVCGFIFFKYFQFSSIALWLYAIIAIKHYLPMHQHTLGPSGGIETFGLGFQHLPWGHSKCQCITKPCVIPILIAMSRNLLPNGASYYCVSRKKSVANGTELNLISKTVSSILSQMTPCYMLLILKAPIRTLADYIVKYCFIFDRQTDRHYFYSLKSITVIWGFTSLQQQWQQVVTKLFEYPCEPKQTNMHVHICIYM